MRNLAYSQYSQYSRCKQITAYILLFIQLFSPLFLAISSVARAATQGPSPIEMQMLDTINGLNSLMAEPSSSTSPGTVPPPTYNSSSFYVPHDNSAPASSVSGSALPLLGGSDKPLDNQVDAQTRLAQGASQAGSLLSSDNNAIDSAVGYARGVGESILNQEVNDWLNQLGKARVSFGTQKTGDADLLVPVFDNPNDIFFTQVGIRANEDRTTTNAGVGYRQYQDGWMWGLNSFYDYDLTGSNARWGVGGELWADYVKLAANGYFRITDWHQSTLSSMRDYDERPANGFDIRAEGYLSSYPQLGAYAKYEQYFGDGIDLGTGTSPSDLKNDPSATTLGVSYTPVPLLTFKGESSRGSSHDSNIGMELTYRLGVPLSQQLDPGKVDLMRSLAGNRYDFVDRNYNIVMQYRKQDLLNISLPDSIEAEAAQTLPVVVTVNKAKYGLKSTAWSAPELLAAGGNIKVTSPTTVDLTLPAYIFKTRSNEPQAYRVYAVGTDNEGNQSNTAMMWVNVKPSQETITQLTLTSAMSPVKSNNSDSYTAVALVQNEKQQVLADKEITFSVSGFKRNDDITLSDSSGNSGKTLTVITDSNGKATIMVKGKIAGQGTLTATMKNGNSRAESMTFVADSTTAQVSELVLTKNKALADGQATNIAVATVVDQFDNPVEAFALNATASNGANVVTPSQVTNSDGQVTIAFKNITAGDSRLTVSGTGTLKTVDAQFVADISTALISSMVVDSDNAIANGVASNGLTVTVVDRNNNVLANAPVTITLPGSAKYTTQPANGLTDSHGQLKIIITNTKAGTENYTAEINNSHITEGLTFKADSANPSASRSNLAVTPNTIKADGVETATLTLTLRDQFDNDILGQSVAFSTSLANTTLSHVTDNGDGTYSATLSGTKKGEAPISVGVNGQALLVNSETVTLVSSSPDQSTSLITVDKASYTSGSDITVTVTLKDAKGNTVTGQVSALTGTTVTVPNAIQKSGSHWVDNGDGIYTNTYMANTTGTGLYASVNLSGWATDANSEAYMITAGDAVQANSSIGVDNTTYVAGSLITVTVTLKDAEGNLAKGQSALLTSSAVTVANASSASGWTDNGDGTYTASYTANTAGTNLKATLQLGGASSSAASSAYSITVGDVVQANSSIGVDNTTYVAGSAITVTVTLKDAEGNLAKGQSALLTSSAVTAANATLVGSWTDNGDGTYTASYTANTAGTNLKATLQLGGASSLASSTAYEITVGGAAQANSSIGVDNTTYVAGKTIKATVTLKDAEGNLVKGQSALLTSSAVTVANATLASGWTDNGNGTYTASYTANTAGTNLKATLQLASASSSASSTAYEITVGDVAQANSSIGVDNTTYVAGSAITVTVTLKDAEGNLAKGQSALLTSSAVTAANATLVGSWTDNGDGTYTASYTANTAGTNLKATLQLAGAGSSASSSAYAITVGDVAQANSSIGVDNTTYVAGSAITVTVTLKDAEGNLAQGQSALLTTSAVTVANATLASSWADNGNGTYTASYTANTAGTGLKATLQLASASSSASSSAYAITVGDVAQANSSIGVDNTTYVAGSAITVTVTLKDAEGNLAKGQSALLTTSAVTAANATLVGSWADNGDGTYTASYTANTAGTGLKATLQLASASSSASSSAYAITVGDVAQANSSIGVDNTTYVAGSAITVTVTLKDAEGNLAKGQSALLTSSTVTVANATLASSWADNGDGTYTASYTANTAGTNLKATLQLASASSSAASSAYSITVGDVVQANSSIGVDNTTYVAGSAITVTVTLKDAEGNLAKGQSALLTSSAVTVANASSASGWTDNGDGTYTASYTANTAGTNLKATLQLAGASSSAASSAYAITVGDVLPANSSIGVDNTTYVAGSAITVTVTLKDAEGNLAQGQSAALTASAVMVANATLASSWTDNGDGTYTASYTANIAGSGLTAILQLAGASVPASSNAYSITVGDVVQANSTIAVDNTTYVAGKVIKATVMLKDAEGNLAKGQSALLTTSAVTVANATLASSWADNGDGTYTASYTANTAGTGLKATLQLAGAGSSASSSAYAITVGDVAQANSSIGVDNTTYVAGSAITVTVTLKDAEGNLAKGQSALLTSSAVTAANATLVGSWTDNGDGTYTASYTANTAGTNLKATLQLAGANSSAASSAYAITVGDVVQANSSIGVDNTTYVSGSAITVTVTLKDAEGNLAQGQSALLTTSAVTVANATLASSWADNGNGTYTASYTANTAGTNLKATLQLGGASSLASSTAYEITVGGAAQANSSIGVDNTTYVAGKTIKATVTLKDAEGNLVKGQSALLTSSAVTVANATLASGWTDNGNGTYTASYTANTAGTGLKATLQLASASSSASSTAYEITVGGAAQANSSIGVDNTTYVAGSAITVTVTLKDAEGNLAKGQSALLTSSAVTAANATLVGSWTDNGDGTYTASYTANTAGTNLKATLQLAGAGSSASSSAYAITVGDVAQANSSIGVDNTTYVAGSAITVTVTLKDAEGNLAKGQSALLTSSAVTAANATLVGSWTDNGDGTYTASYTANTAGTGLKATLQLASASSSASSSAYAITVGDVAQANSSIGVDNTTYVAGSAITVTVTLKDAEGNLAKGQSALLTTSAVTVANATLASSWTDNSNGTYTASYTANTAGTNLKATLQLAGASSSASSNTYAITVGDVVQANSTVTVDKASYAAGTDITVTVTLKDNMSNLVMGQSAALTSTTVTVPNATIKASSRWVDNGDGTYTGTYVANTTGTGLKASVKLSTWSNTVMSNVYAITAGVPDLNKGSLTIDKSRIFANNTESAKVTLHVVDNYGNVVPNLTQVKFVVEDNLGSIITSGVSVGDVTQGDNAGDYTATILGNKAGNYKIKAQVGTDYFSVPSVDLTLYSYNFYINTNVTNRKIIPTQTVDYVLSAKTTDNVGLEVSVDNVTWSSSNNSIAKIDAGSNHLIAVTEGIVTITASNISLNGITGDNITTTLTVRPVETSQVYGVINGGYTEDLIKAPKYQLYTKTGNIVDGVGSNLTGGGDTFVNIENLNKMSTIETVVCRRQGNLFGGLIGQLIFTSQTAVQKAGRGQCGGTTDTATWNVPANANIVGVRTWLGTSDTGFRGVVGIQWLYYIESDSN